MKDTVVVTGDSRGLGETIVENLIDRDYKVLGISRSENNSIKKRKKDNPKRYKSINFDISNTRKIRELYRSEIKKEGPVVGLVNNAGIAYDDLVTNSDSESIEKMFRVNVHAAVLLSKFAIRDMLLHRVSGALVHISSVSTATGYSGLSMYGASKSALEGLSRGIAREWGERGIRSNCVAPGFMETEMTSGLSEDQRKQIHRRTALQKPTEQESVADLVAFLLSEAAGSITGETIRVDAGTL